MSDPIVTELTGWQYVNGRKRAVCRTDDGFRISGAATGVQVCVAMVALLSPISQPEPSIGDRVKLDPVSVIEIPSAET